MNQPLKGMAPNSLSTQQIALLNGETPEIDIFGEVNHRMFLYARAAIMELCSRGSPDVCLRISSPGGSVDNGLDIYDLLRLYKGSITATVYGEASSMGALILQACETRRCAQHSHILIHHVSRSNITLDELRSRKRLAEVKENMERDQKRLYKILSDRTGKTVPEIRKVCAKDEYMTAEEALGFGLIDEII